MVGWGPAKNCSTINSYLEKKEELLKEKEEKQEEEERRRENGRRSNSSSYPRLRGRIHPFPGCKAPIMFNCRAPTWQHKWINWQQLFLEMRCKLPPTYKLCIQARSRLSWPTSSLGPTVAFSTSAATCAPGGWHATINGGWKDAALFVSSQLGRLRDAYSDDLK